MTKLISNSAIECVCAAEEGSLFSTSSILEFLQQFWKVVSSRVHITTKNWAIYKCKLNNLQKELLEYYNTCQELKLIYKKRNSNNRTRIKTSLFFEQKLVEYIEEGGTFNEPQFLPTVLYNDINCYIDNIILYVESKLAVLDKYPQSKLQLGRLTQVCNLCSG